MDAERQRVRMLVSDNIDQPLLRFVVAEAEAAHPALLGMAPKEGTLAINGAEFSFGEAKAGDAKLRRHAKQRRNEDWQTIVIPAPGTRGA